MGISSKKSKTSTTQNTSMTSTPTNPEWVTSGLGALGGRISSTFAGLDPSSLVPGADPLQTQAAQGAAGLGQFGGYGGGSAAAMGPKRAAMMANGGSSGGPGLFAESAGPKRAAMLASGQGGAASTGNPYGDAMSTFNDMRGSQANLAGISTGQATSGNAASLLDNLDAYMNPYTDRVVDTSLAGFDRDRNLTRQQQALDLAGDETFGGSGGSILRALTEGELGLSRGQLESGLRADAFNTGAMLSNQDADRRQGMSLANLNAQNTFGLANMDAQNSGAQFNASQRDGALQRQMAGAAGLAGTASEMQEQQRQNIASQSGMGEMLRQIQQQQAMAPIAALGMEGSLWNSLPLDLLKGQTSTGTMTGTTKTKESGASMGDWLSYLSANAQAAAAAGASDERLKEDIETIGHDAKGRRWVEWTYRFWPGKRFRGVIAQEVIKTDPHAVREGPGGFLFVNYAALEA
jgi:hypothetical protein